MRRFRELVSLAVFVAVFVPVYVATRLLTVTLHAFRWEHWWPVVQRRLGIQRRVLFLEVFFPEASGYIYRVTNWAPVLEGAGFTVRVKHPVGQHTSQALLSRGWTGLF